MAVYFYKLRSEASNVASFVLLNESFISGHVLKKAQESRGFFLRRETQHSLKSYIHFLCGSTAVVFYTEIFMLWLFNAHLCLDLIQILFCLSLFQLLKAAICTMSKQD